MSSPPPPSRTSLRAPRLRSRLAAGGGTGDTGSATSSRPVGGKAGGKSGGSGGGGTAASGEGAMGITRTALGVIAGGSGGHCAVRGGGAGLDGGAAGHRALTAPTPMPITANAAMAAFIASPVGVV